MGRPKWGSYFMEIAGVVATRATCDRRHVGCVIVDPLNRILATGYNGSPPYQPHCDDVGHVIEDGHCVATTHAEANAVASASLTGTKLRGGIAYCTLEPCRACQNLMQSAGIARVYYRDTYAGKPDTAFMQQWKEDKDD